MTGECLFAPTWRNGRYTAPRNAQWLDAGLFGVYDGACGLLFHNMYMVGTGECLFAPTWRNGRYAAPRNVKWLECLFDVYDGDCGLLFHYEATLFNGDQHHTGRFVKE